MSKKFNQIELSSQKKEGEGKKVEEQSLIQLKKDL